MNIKRDNHIFTIFFILIILVGIVSAAWSCSNYYKCMEAEKKAGLSWGKAYNICHVAFRSDD